eukprot:gb/GECG01000402.1/.p1 GENE.gb/GECG01000402.1/~~gb/GECG01000402.1/.p1  ORF type:complete len:153 (+),score=31.87 gb/GECG01000402.1/:1-459(+)
MSSSDPVVQQNKRTLYVGGLSEEVTEDILNAAFIPFGDIAQVNMPLDPNKEDTEQHRGFAFVEFEDENDAEEAIDNMDMSELCGRVIRVNHARPMKAGQTAPSKAVWEDADAWYKTALREEGISAEKEAQESAKDSSAQYDSLQPAKEKNIQ